MTQSQLTERKAQLEAELAAINQQIKQPPKTIQEVVERVKPMWWNKAIQGTQIKSTLYPGRGSTHSEPAARQLQALNDLQNWCKALNEHFGSDGKKWYVSYYQPNVPAVQEASVWWHSHSHALTPFRSKAAAEYAITCPDFCEALKTLYTPCE